MVISSDTKWVYRWVSAIIIGSIRLILFCRLFLWDLIYVHWNLYSMMVLFSFFHVLFSVGAHMSKRHNNRLWEFNSFCSLVSLKSIMCSLIFTFCGAASSLAFISCVVLVLIWVSVITTCYVNLISFWHRVSSESVLCSQTFVSYEAASFLSIIFHAVEEVYTSSRCMPLTF